MKNDRLLFLDIDGVLSSARSMIAGYKFDPVGCALIAKLCETFNLKICVSSTWRFDGASLKKTLLQYGLQKYRYTDEPSTPSNHEKIRGDEIQWVINTHDIKNYIIIDDDSDMLENQLQYFIQTNTNEGFLYSHFVQSKNILQEQLHLPKVGIANE